jgi:hypothetical protein
MVGEFAGPINVEIVEKIISKYRVPTIAIHPGEHLGEEFDHPVI